MPSTPQKEPNLDLNRGLRIEIVRIVSLSDVAFEFVGSAAELKSKPIQFRGLKPAVILNGQLFVK